MNKKGQAIPFMAILLVIILLAIGATALIGEIGWQKIRVANIADSALIAASSDLCRKLNQIRSIHFQMLLNYVRVQTALLSRGIWPSKHAGQQFAYYVSGMGIFTGFDLFSAADKLAKEAPKGLRGSLIDRVLGGALIDEPKPFLEKGDNFDENGNPIPNGDDDEVLRDKDGKVVKILYDVYLNRDPYLIELLRAFKKDNPDNWFDNDLFAYAWNKQKPDPDKDFIYGKLVVLAQNGELPGDFDAYNAYLTLNLINVPREGSISVEPQAMVLFYLYKCGKSVCPAFIPHPWAWIRKINISNKNFGMKVGKLAFRTFPLYYPKDKESQEKEKPPMFGRENGINITGGIWSGFEPKLEK